jgi:spoIIIJ-associated protein
VKEVTISGRSIEEAIETALTQLETSRDQVEVEIMEESKKGFLGLGAKPAVVKVIKKVNPIEEGITFIKNVAEKMGITVTVSVKEEGNAYVFELSSEKAALLIGKRGQTLNALQYLTNLAANKTVRSEKRILLDAENYRARRRETLEGLANHLASKAINTKQTVTLEPMSSQDRKVIHIALKENKKVKTYSDGAEPRRKVIIEPIL